MDLFTNIEALKNREVDCPLGVWEEFLKSHIWRDITEEMQVWLVDTWQMLETEEDPVTISALQGRARSIRETLLLPAMIRDRKRVEDEMKNLEMED